MKGLAAALVLVTVIGLASVPPASADASTDAALALGAFAVFNQLVRGETVFSGFFAAPRPVVVPPPVVYAPPPPVVYAPAPRVVYAPAPVVVPAPPPHVHYRPLYGAPHVKWKAKGDYWKHGWHRR